MGYKLKYTGQEIDNILDNVGTKQPTLISGTNIKTINGETILGEGDITISGGSSSEDIRYFTEFTVEDFRAACKNESEVSSNGLYDAIINNKLICIPNGDAGYLIAGSSYIDSQNLSDRYSFTLSINFDQINYLAMIDTDDLTMDSLIGTPNTIIAQVEILNSPIEYWSDNKYYVIYNTVNELVICYLGGHYGTTINFTTGDDPVLEIVGDVFWANGVAPEIEANTNYELSLRGSVSETEVLAVLVPFKSV